MPHRYLIRPQHLIDPPPERFESEQVLQLNEERTRYLISVMRLRAGDVVHCFDGAGVAFDATLMATPRRRGTAQLQVTTVRTQAPLLTPEIHIGLSLLKGSAMDRAVTLATELGAASITPLMTQYVNVRMSDERKDNKHLHWEKLIDSACEQSGRLHVPPLYATTDLTQYLEQHKTARDTLTVLQMGCAPLDWRNPTTAVRLLIGPEGGWSESELAMFDTLKLNQRSIHNATLRAESAPGIALGILQHLTALDR